jgi:hypothetical protein
MVNLIKSCRAEEEEDGKPRIFTEADQIENFATHRKFDVTVTCITECRKKVTLLLTQYRWTICGQKPKFGNIQKVLPTFK